MIIELASVNFFVIWLVVLGGITVIKIVKNHYED
jgi:hypothetical protein